MCLDLFVTDFDQSAAEFGVVRKLDPYGLDVVDVFSHVLFVMVKELMAMPAFA